MLPDLSFFLIVGAVLLVGAAVQGSVGLGLGMVGAPIVTLLDPTLMPGSLLTATLILPIVMVGTEWRHVDLSGVSWALAGRVVGTVGGVWVVSVLPVDELSLAVGLLIVAAVLMTIRTIRFRTTPATLATAGAMSGLTGTATAVGGFPIALIYQHDPGPRVRATLSGFFMFGILLSLIGLAVGGQLATREVATGAALVPFVLAGYLVAAPLKRHADGRLMRGGLLTVVAISGLVLVTQYFT